LSKSIKNILKLALVFGIGFVFLYFVFEDVDWDSQLNKMRNAHLGWLSLGIGISVISHWIRAYRANLLYKAIGYKVSNTNSFMAVLVGYMFNYFIPRAGEVSRCASLMKTSQLPIDKSLGTVVTERLVDLLMLVLVLASIFLLQFELIWNFISAYLPNSNKGLSLNQSILVGVFFLLLIALVVKRKQVLKMSPVQKIITLLQGFKEGVLSIFKLEKPLLFIFLSVAIWVGYILMMYFCLFALESTAQLSFINCLTVFAIGTIGVVLPAPGAGAGTYHFFVTQALVLFGIAKADGLAYATLVHGSQMILLIVLGILASIYVMVQKRNMPSENQVKL